MTDDRENPSMAARAQEAQKQPDHDRSLPLPAHIGLDTGTPSVAQEQAQAAGYTGPGTGGFAVTDKRGLAAVNGGQDEQEAIARQMSGVSEPAPSPASLPAPEAVEEPEVDDTAQQRAAVVQALSFALTEKQQVTLGEGELSFLVDQLLELSALKAGAMVAAANGQPPSGVQAAAECDVLLMLAVTGNDLAATDGADYGPLFGMHVRERLTRLDDNPLDNLERILVVIDKADTTLRSDFQSMKTSSLVITHLQRLGMQAQELAQIQAARAQLAAQPNGSLRRG